MFSQILCLHTNALLELLEVWSKEGGKVILVIHRFVAKASTIQYKDFAKASILRKM